MHKLRRFYYKNKEKIWAIIIFIVLVFLSIQLLNKLMRMENQNEQNQLNGINNIDTTYSGNGNTHITNEESVVTGEKVDEKDLEDASKVIEEFVSACNNQNIEQAYNLVSTDCKNEMYQNIEKFKTLYYDQIFNTNTKKIANIENWVLNTYRVNILNDMMSTGNLSDQGIQDNITVVEENDELKLNLNNYIGREEINKEQIIDDIKFNIIEKHIYMDYEIYKIKVENQSENNIVLDTLEDPKTIYLQDSNNVKYYAYSNELIDNMLKVNKNFSTEIEVKFSKAYSSSKAEMKSIIFSDVIINNNNTDKKSIKINL